MFSSGGWPDLWDYGFWLESIEEVMFSCQESLPSFPHPTRPHQTPGNWNMLHVLVHIGNGLCRYLQIISSLPANPGCIFDWNALRKPWLQISSRAWPESQNHGIWLEGIKKTFLPGDGQSPRTMEFDWKASRKQWTYELQNIQWAYEIKKCFRCRPILKMALVDINKSSVPCQQAQLRLWISGRY